MFPDYKMDIEESKPDNDTSLDTSLDTKEYPSDYVSDLFNSIDWGSRVKNPRSETRWIDPGSWDSSSYTMKYLEYKIEDGQVDLTNPFHIEESNKIRTRLDKKSKVGLTTLWKYLLNSYYFLYLREEKAKK